MSQENFRFVKFVKENCLPLRQGKMINEMSHNGVKAFDEDIFLDKMSSFDTLYLAGYELGMLYEIPFHVN